MSLGGPVVHPSITTLARCWRNRYIRWVQSSALPETSRRCPADRDCKRTAEQQDASRGTVTPSPSLFIAAWLLLSGIERRYLATLPVAIVTSIRHRPDALGGGA
jgi:hypothetical protein